MRENLVDIGLSETTKYLDHKGGYFVMMCIEHVYFIFRDLPVLALVTGMQQVKSLQEISEQYLVKLQISKPTAQQNHFWIYSLEKFPNLYASKETYMRLFTVTVYNEKNK